MSRHSASPLDLSTAEMNDLRHGRPIRGDATAWHAPVHHVDVAGSDLPSRGADLPDQPRKV